VPDLGHSGVVFHSYIMAPKDSRVEPTHMEHLGHLHRPDAEHHGQVIDPMITTIGIRRRPRWCSSLMISFLVEECDQCRWRNLYACR
jgi:hypothetical protein